MSRQRVANRLEPGQVLVHRLRGKYHVYARFSPYAHVRLPYDDPCMQTWISGPYDTQEEAQAARSKLIGAVPVGVKDGDWSFRIAPRPLHDGHWEREDYLNERAETMFGDDDVDEDLAREFAL